MRNLLLQIGYILEKIKMKLSNRQENIIKKIVNKYTVEIHKHFFRKALHLKLLTQLHKFTIK